MGRRVEAQRRFPTGTFVTRGFKSANVARESPPRRGSCGLILSVLTPVTIDQTLGSVHEPVNDEIIERGGKGAALLALVEPYAEREQARKIIENDLLIRELCVKPYLNRLARNPHFE
jgi:hypothetical protein